MFCYKLLSFLHVKISHKSTKEGNSRHFHDKLNTVQLLFPKQNAICVGVFEQEIECPSSQHPTNKHTCTMYTSNPHPHPQEINGRNMFVLDKSPVASKSYILKFSPEKPEPETRVCKKSSA